MDPSFWTSLAKPTIGLSPMDGVTDPAFRMLVDTIGKPGILYTEFVSAEGIARGVTAILDTFVTHDTATPLVGQLFAGDPESVYTASVVLAELGMDGIDINMGCPNKHITKKGGGAALILDPARAVSLIAAAKRASSDWANGRTAQDVGMPEPVLAFIRAHGRVRPRRLLPVSVKTRIGYNRFATDTWIPTLIDAGVSAIALHGRLYTKGHAGPVAWDEIGNAASMASAAGVRLLGNGGIASFTEATSTAATYCPDGVLIGQASFGNPWVFSGATPTMEERLSVASAHIRAFTELTPNANPLALRKHLAWYIKGFPDTGAIRDRIMREVVSAESAAALIENLAASLTSR